MDKYELVLDIIEHPENYTSEQLKKILSESETGAIYNLLCKTDSAIKANEPDINAEWEKFSERHTLRHRRQFSWLGSRAASIAAVIGTSIVAVAAGIAVTVSVIGHSPEPVADEATDTPGVVAATADSAYNQNDSVNVALTPIMFENETLATIMKTISEAYGVEVKFNSTDVASLHLYYKFDPSLSLNEVVGQLNTFEQIEIRQNGNFLTVF